MKLGHCLDCGQAFESEIVKDDVCPACAELEPRNDPSIQDDADHPRWRWTRSAMRERLGISGDRDE